MQLNCLPYFLHLTLSSPLLSLILHYSITLTLHSHVISVKRVASVLLVYDPELVTVTASIICLVIIRRGKTMTQIRSGIAGHKAGCRTSYNAVQARTLGLIPSLDGPLGSKGNGWGWVSQMRLVGAIKASWGTQGHGNLYSGIMMLHSLDFFYPLYL